jgi:hypothetical protein
LIVSREQLRRALLVLHAIVREAERRGHEVAAVNKSGYGDRPGIGVVIRGHAYQIEITEATDRVPLTQAEIAEWERRDNRHRFDWESKPKRPATKGVPNGRLRASLPTRWHGARCNWTEGPRGGLDVKLSQLFEELDRRADEDDRRAEERARRDAELRRQQEERLERELRARIERARVDRLRGEIDTWHLARAAREYVTVVRARLQELGSEDEERVGQWCDWIERWSRLADPTLNLQRIRGLDDERDRLYSPGR